VVWFQVVERDYVPSKATRLPPIQWVSRTLSPGASWPISSIQCQRHKWWRYISAPPIRLHDEAIHLLSTERTLHFIFLDISHVLLRYVSPVYLNNRIIMSTAQYTEEWKWGWFEVFTEIYFSSFLTGLRLSPLGMAATILPVAPGAGPPLWSSGQSSWLHIQRSEFDSRRYHIFLRSSGSGTGSTREYDWGVTWNKKRLLPEGSAALTSRRSLTANVGSNFGDKRRSHYRYSSFADPGHGVVFVLAVDDRWWWCVFSTSPHDLPRVRNWAPGMGIQWAAAIWHLLLSDAE
jgi:hypothetical protein